MTSKPTLVTLARELGVSRQTVSNVINAPHRVRPETLARVRRAIDESGYRPSSAARQLKTRRSMNLAIRLYPSTDGINGSILDRFLHAATEAAQRQGYRLTLFTAADDAEEIASYEELLQVADLDGFILTSTHHEDARADWLLAHDVPFVAFGRPWSDQDDPAAAPHDWVDIDGAAGTAEATRMLLGRGHRRIGFLGWPRGSGAGDDRRRGWAETMAQAAPEVDREPLTVEVEDEVGHGAAGAQVLLDRGATAVVCVSDSLALGAGTTWRRVRPGSWEEPHVIGFDDTPVAQAVGLSSVRQPIEEAAQRVVAMLLEQLTGDGVRRTSPRHELLTAHLAARRGAPFMSVTEPGPTGAPGSKETRSHP
jgi:DNA-binding LacI/PurR family transcriptional regulator